MATQKSPKAPKPPTKVKAAAWGDGDELVLLAARGGKLLLLTVRAGQIVDETPALSGANRVALLGSTRLMLDGNGKSRAVSPSGKRNTQIPGFSPVDLVVCHGTAYACGGHRVVARYDEANGTWEGMKLATATAKLVHGHTDKVHSLAVGARGPIAGLFAGTYFGTLVMEWDGSNWVERARLEGRFNAIARDPGQDAVYAVGDGVVVVDRHGAVRTLVVDDDDLSLWSCAWLTPSAARPKGALLAGTLRGVKEIEVDGAVTERLVPGDGEVPNNHSLFGQGSRAAFVCAGRVHVTDGGERWTTVALP